MSILVLKSKILDLELILILQINSSWTWPCTWQSAFYQIIWKGSPNSTTLPIYTSVDARICTVICMYTYVYCIYCMYILHVYSRGGVDMVEVQTRRHSKHKGGSEKLTTDARLLMEERWTIVFTVKYFYQIQRSFKTRYEWYQQACVWIRALCFCWKKAWETVQVALDSSDWPQIWLFQGM